MNIFYIMNNLNQYIIEKLKLNKDIKVNNVYFDNNGNFSDSDINKINEFIENLPISPKEVKLVDKGNTIVLKFANSTKQNEFVNEFVRIFISILPKYKVGFRKSLNNNVIFYPKVGSFDTIEECFDCINENWNNWQKQF